MYAGAVPIVWGSTREEYEKVAPIDSFIHVSDFDYDPVRLALYINHLSLDDELYKQYFKLAQQ